ncbi:putative arylsulfatase [Neohortaea acidophila]|uniref:Putative arylsulfatase n=1 Tax=Neohortaea acidophila TaxID=245834 RepID=A0A6A6PTH0_9PEZI|nr:putative arylsulfatase [Neohortaea acidophila]KAF2483066.1 putative arylsulfatase [Neohortaea acidophila]
MAPKRPNFLIVLADDLGFSDVGCYGGEIRTPNIDKLARDGFRMTDFHATALCSPSRSMILTGTDNHIAGLGSLVEWLATPIGANPKGLKESPAPARGKPGYEGYLNERVVTLPEVLRDAGYLTLISGKWHLGLRKDKAPRARGFERAFALLPGASNHFGWEPQLEEGEPEGPKMFTTSYPLHVQDDEYVHHLPKGWYSSNSYGDTLLQYLKDWKADNDKADETNHRPFFAYLPFTAPHWPLHAPQEYIQHYRGMYDDGPDALRLRRLARLKELGLVDKDVEPHPVVASEVSEWDDMSAEARQLSARAMETYSGMVECIDHNVGKVVDYLEGIGELENTFVMFMSDNGAEGGAHEANPAFQGGPMTYLQKYYDNSLENIGNYNSFTWYGPRWAQASTAPSRMYKSYTTEGGIRVPCVVKLPTSYSCPIPRGGITHKFSTIMDIMPTFLDMAGVRHPAPTYQGREVVHMRGKSMVPWLNGEANAIHQADFVEGWEMGGRAAVRKNNWKAVYLPERNHGPSRAGRSKWELFDLDKDPGEIHDLCDQHPDIMKELLKLWDQYVVETGVIPLNPALGEYIAATEEQMPDNGWIEYEFWKRGARENPEKFFHTPKRFDREGNRVEFKDGAFVKV